MTHRTLTRLAATAAILAAVALPAQAQQGVSKDELLIGSILDLSGPLAGYGKDLRNGMNLRIAEVNEQGGVHGAQKLVNQDKVFVMVGMLGAASANAAMPTLAQKNVMNFFPMALAKDCLLYTSPSPRDS